MIKSYTISNLPATMNKNIRIVAKDLNDKWIASGGVEFNFKTGIKQLTSVEFLNYSMGVQSYRMKYSSNASTEFTVKCTIYIQEGQTRTALTTFYVKIFPMIITEHTGILNNVSPGSTYQLVFVLEHYTEDLVKFTKSETTVSLVTPKIQLPKVTNLVVTKTSSSDGISATWNHIPAEPYDAVNRYNLIIKDINTNEVLVTAEALEVNSFVDESVNTDIKYRVCELSVEAYDTSLKNINSYKQINLFEFKGIKSEVTNIRVKSFIPKPDVGFGTTITWDHDRITTGYEIYNSSDTKVATVVDKEWTTSVGGIYKIVPTFNSNFYLDNVVIVGVSYTVVIRERVEPVVLTRTVFLKNVEKYTWPAVVKAGGNIKYCVYKKINDVDTLQTEITALTCEFNGIGEYKVITRDSNNVYIDSLPVLVEVGDAPVINLTSFTDANITKTMMSYTYLMLDFVYNFDTGYADIEFNIYLSEVLKTTLTKYSILSYSFNNLTDGEKYVLKILLHDKNGNYNDFVFIKEYTLPLKILDESQIISTSLNDSGDLSLIVDKIDETPFVGADVQYEVYVDDVLKDTFT